MQGLGTRAWRLQTTSCTGAPVSAASCCGVSWKTPFGWPAAAQIRSKRYSSRSIRMNGRSLCPTGETPPMTKPVRLSRSRPRRGRAAPVTARDLALVDTPVARGHDQHRRVVGQRRKTTLFAIWPRLTPSASAASCAVRAATSSHKGACGWPRRPAPAATRRKPSGRSADSVMRAALAQQRLARTRHRRPAEHSEMKAPASTSASMSIPVAIPRP